MTHTDEAVLELAGPLDLPRTLGILQRGSGDPAVRVDPVAASGGPAGTPGAGAWLCRRIYDRAGSELGQVTLRIDQLDAATVRVRAAGSSAEAAAAGLESAAGMLGVEDDWLELELLLDALGDRVSTTLAQVRRRHPGVRLPAAGGLFDQLVTVTLEQKVTHDQARHCWRQLLRRHGERPPSSARLPAPEWMRLPLTPAALKRIPSWEWHQLWVQPALSKTIQRVADRAAAIHRLDVSTPAETFSVGLLAEQLTGLPGIGQWTAAEALQRSHGAADLPAVGDYHLAHFVGEALTGRRTDDEGMLQLLEPFRPHRQRVIRLLVLSGFRQQRFGPRLAPADHRGR
ncbi:3-methyladenine DNA glycosylase [Nesterenkonia sp.]|uniref:DNA-3-methyladenine glycosylase family protein n=1 Tax=Nesterenkonia sp. TaxID=704201 RepID=UPI0026211AC5|nr:3-methyladenine DNA glycosylase [Nesterenkonia sp.]